MDGFRNTGPFQRMLDAGTPEVLRDCQVLPEETWRRIDTMVSEEMRDRAVFAASLVSVPVEGGFRSLNTTLQRMTGLDDAVVSMLGTGDDSDRIDFKAQTIPLPVTHKRFDLNWRTMGAAELDGISIQMLSARSAATAMALGVEDPCILGGDTFNGNAIYGATTHPNRIQKTVTETDNPSFVQGLVEARVELSRRGYPGPFSLYLSQDYDARLEQDYRGDYSMTLRQRLASVFSGVTVLPRLTGSVAIIKQQGVYGGILLRGQAPTTVQWTSGDRFETTFKHWCIEVPAFPIVEYRTKKGGTGSSIGVVHCTIS